MTRRLAFGLALVMTLSACGGRQALKPAAGASAIPTARGAAAPQTPPELMAPSPQSRPERNAELLTQSRERTVDPFDLPPQGQ
ncbi:hypothetical protein [Sphingobium algorifonticola]|uniref:Argininosuccinate lyase n=1 Tax=Sphingobium algorifonticola TaxID=2008318 RepID=A0A437JDE5_9SPHN|nr:hypothetical protein [Sphingobium algorifonticola]RVT43935.1 hypothetical protein ENE74_04975 [Sphingobium algorifonticola]